MGFFDKINYSMIGNAFKQVCDRRHCEMFLDRNQSINQSIFKVS